jgi:indolepyruvate ferredoxin oxidoreductase
MSRYSGYWVGMKVITETVETTAEINLANELKPFNIPTDFAMPEGGLNLRWPDDRYDQDRRLQDYKGLAAIAFARANHINRITMDSPKARFGIMASGKSYEDVRQALRELGVTEQVASKIGLRLYKIGMPWPLEPEGVRQFAAGLEEIFIVEERLEIVENQVKQELFNSPGLRPRIVGKMDDKDQRFLPFAEELSVARVATSLVDRLLAMEIDPEIAALLRAKADWFHGRDASQVQAVVPITRTPYFCSGCPHNTSIKVPEGSRALAGIVCHFMTLWMDRNTETFTHMGGEGVPWTGIAPITKEKHIFANLGDGTYFHSGSLAIRQSIASKANITYKILYKDAVAMTGGQKHDGDLSPQQITFQLHSEGIRDIYLLSENPDAYPAKDIASGVKLAHRDELDNVMKALRDVPGCSAIVFVQTCAAEKRRRRKRGTLEDRSAASSSIPRSAKAAAIARCSRIAFRSSRWRPNLVANAPSTSRPATRTTPASRGSARPSCHGRRRQVEAQGAGRTRQHRRAAGTAVAARPRAALQRRYRRCRWHRRADDRRATRHGRACRGQGQHDFGHVGPGAKGRGRP